MRAIAAKFFRWLAGLSVISRYFTVALIAHLGLVLFLTTIKLISQTLPLPVGENVPFNPQDWPRFDPAPTDDERRGGGVQGEIEKPISDGGTMSKPPASSRNDALDPVAKNFRDIPDQTAEVPMPAPTDFAKYRPDDSQTLEFYVPVSDTKESNPGSGGARSGRLGNAPGIYQNRDVLPTGDRRNVSGPDIVPTEEDPTLKGIRAALRWMQTTQEKDGYWKCAGSDEAGTALALLAYLGVGQTPDSDEFGDTVQRGLEYLIKTIGDDGMVKGGNMYVHGVVTLALGEAYALTRSPHFELPLQLAVNAIVRSQQSAKASVHHRGGWRYTPDTDTSDVSVSGWIIMALKTARTAGITVPQSTFDQAEEFLWGMYAKPGFGYSSPVATPTMTGVGVLCMQFLGHGDDRRLDEAVRFIGKQSVDWDKTDGGFVMYGWYYMTHALQQAGGAPWKSWHRQINPALLAQQSEEGHWLPPPSSGERERFAKTPIYSTALATLILEAPYRYAAETKPKSPPSRFAPNFAMAK